MKRLFPTKNKVFLFEEKKMVEKRKKITDGPIISKITIMSALGFSISYSVCVCVAIFKFLF
jgi:hypothetical protein